MKFVYFGYDFMLGSVEQLRADGHDLVGIFTFPCDNIFNFNTNTHALAESLNIPITESKPTAEDLNSYIAAGVETFFAAGYPYKIPPIDDEQAYGLNLHPSFLPKGRGMMPTPTIIMSAPEAAGITVHKLTPKYDEGDIIDQTPFTLDPFETVDTYAARVALAAPEMITRIFDDIKQYWIMAKPQDKNEVALFPTPDDAMRTIDWNAPLKDIDAKARAFGRYGCLAYIENQHWVIYDHDILKTPHQNSVGHPILPNLHQKIIPVKNGYFIIKRGEILS